MVGHPTAPCPYGNPDAAPNLAKAKQLIAQVRRHGCGRDGLERGAPAAHAVRAPYYASVLTELGFKVDDQADRRHAVLPDDRRALKNNPQTGFADWDEDFPNPGDFYLLLDKRSILPVNNQNFSQVDDPHIQSAIERLDAIPSSDLASVASQWTALDEYTAQKAYEDVYGYQTWPKFTSTRIDYKALLVQPSYGWDWTSIKLAS